MVAERMLILIADRSEMGSSAHGMRPLSRDEHRAAESALDYCASIRGVPVKIRHLDTSLSVPMICVLAVVSALAVAPACASEDSVLVNHDNPCGPGRIGPTYLPDNRVLECSCSPGRIGTLTCSKGAAVCFCDADAGGDTAGDGVADVGERRSGTLTCSKGAAGRGCVLLWR